MPRAIHKSKPIASRAGSQKKTANFSPWFIAAFLSIATLSLYWPALHNGFVDYDDDSYLTANAQVQSGLTAENFKWAFTHSVAGNWHPITMLSHMLVCQLCGLRPFGHHLLNVLLHAAAPPTQ